MTPAIKRSFSAFNPEDYNLKEVNFITFKICINFIIILMNKREKQDHLFTLSVYKVYLYKYIFNLTTIILKMRL